MTRLNVSSGIERCWFGTMDCRFVRTYMRMRVLLSICPTRHEFTIQLVAFMLHQILTADPTVTSTGINFRRVQLANISLTYTETFISFYVPTR